MLQKEADQPKEVRGYALHFLAFFLWSDIHSQALRTFLAMLKFSVHNMTVIDEVLPLLSRLRDWKKGIEILQNAFDYFRTKYPHGPPSAPALDSDVDPALQPLTHQNLSLDDVETPFRDVHIVALADYCLLLQYHEKAILAIRNGARWLQGRRMQTQWEGLPDDREFDLDPGLRKGGVLLSSGPGTRNGVHLLDVNMRHRLARARIKMGDHNEGRVSGLLF
jgi:general transcription factor 3C polypeptide 3 (transcription factor C subunit 4)